jgi:hypothetical protein
MCVYVHVCVTQCVLCCVACLCVVLCCVACYCVVCIHCANVSADVDCSGVGVCVSARCCALWTVCVCTFVPWCVCAGPCNVFYLQLLAVDPWELDLTFAFWSCLLLQHIPCFLLHIHTCNHSYIHHHSCINAILLCQFFQPPPSHGHHVVMMVLHRGAAHSGAQPATSCGGPCQQRCGCQGDQEHLSSCPFQQF